MSSAGKPPRRLVPALKILLLVLAATLLLLGACLGYIGYKAHDAATSIDAFCGSVAVGQPSAGIAERARASGLEVRELSGRPEEGTVAEDSLLCMKGVFLAQHVCEVTHSQGRVTRVQRSFID